VKRSRVPVGVAIVVLAALSGCADSRQTGGEVDTRRWAVDGLSFENPHGYKKLDVGEVADTATDVDGVDDVADSMGIPSNTLVEMMKQVDLYLVGAVSAPGFADNVSVVEQPGRVPGEEELKTQFAAIGAKLADYETVDTDLGEVVAASYSLKAGKVNVEGETLIVDVDGAVFITITSSERATTDEVAEGILETLAED